MTVDAVGAEGEEGHNDGRSVGPDPAGGGKKRTLPNGRSRYGLILRHGPAILLLGAVLHLTYANSFNAGFTLDNKFKILEDPRIRGLDEQNLRLIFSREYWWPSHQGGLYRPLTTLTYLFNYAVVGDAQNPTGYHWVNFLLHWINASLVYLLALELLPGLWLAFFTAALFAAHPVNVESVTNIVGRADLLGGLCVLAGLLLYLESARRERRTLWLAGVSLAMLAGVFSKESAVVLVGLMAAYDLTYRGKRTNLAAYLWLLPPLLILLGARWWVFSGVGPADNDFVATPLPDGFWAARLTALKVLGKYLWLLVWPRTLSCDYSYNQIPPFAWNDPKAVITLLLLAAIGALAVLSYWRNKAVCFLILFFGIALLPASNLVVRIGSIMAERFLYLPSVAFCGCVVLAVARLFGPRRRAAACVLVAIVVAYGTRSFARNFDWTDDVSLWTEAAEASPESFKTHRSLALALSQMPAQGSESLDRAIQEVEKALRIVAPLPAERSSTETYVTAGALYGMKGDSLARSGPGGVAVPTLESLAWYRRASEVLTEALPIERAFTDRRRRAKVAYGIAPDQVIADGNADLWVNLAFVWIRLNNRPKAVEALLGLRRLAPASSDVYRSLGGLYADMGRNEEAVTAYLQCLTLQPNDPDAKEKLAAIYRKVDSEGCGMNLQCPSMREHLRAAYDGLADILTEAHRYDEAQFVQDARNRQRLLP
ncbi:MAG: tetratricopeptide repeat protein [Vicinamibacteria bacterium]